MSTRTIMTTKSYRSEPYPLRRFDRQRHYDDDYTSSSSSDFDRSSNSSYGSRTTAPTSLRSAPKTPQPNTVVHQEEMPPRLGYKFHHLDPSASVETYNSVFSDDVSMNDADGTSNESGLPIPTDDAIPQYLPEYRASIVDPTVRPSNPEVFGNLWPSRDGLLIRHDDLTPDGNMNLRVDTVVPTANGRITLQLFHFAIDNMSMRHCSLIRYCRDSGREVCNYKRAYAEPPRTSRPGIQRSVSSAMRAVKHPFRRDSTASTKSRPLSGCSEASWDTASIRSMRMRSDSWSSDNPPPPASSLVPTNTIKVEFSNYARLDISRNGRKSKHYDFEWWGHKYTWKRVFDKNLNVASYHLIRDGEKTPVAHITPDMRSPNQIDEDEWAGGWVPPCHMWIRDQSIINATTDVADIVVATGLIALVDDCIKDRWHIKKQPKKSIRAVSNDTAHSDATSLMRKLFHRRHSALHTSSPLRPQSRMVSAY